MDEQNHDTIFCVDELLKMVKPRMVTVEQTFGFAFPKFQQAFNTFAKQFTDNGYSISWQIIELENYGLPQRRKRLVMMAAGPGETLPHFPSPTHSSNPRDGLQKLVTVSSVIDRIPRNAPNHNIRAAQGRMYPVWNGNDILRSTICTAGVTRSQIVNGKKNTSLGIPTGLRGFTHREIAALQGFPHHHIFMDERITFVRKMIGNAYPPIVAKAHLNCIREQLEKTDREELHQSRPHVRQRVQEREVWEL
jgi:DNA (cytosine-5)-methyltransferase 1